MSVFKRGNSQIWVIQFMLKGQTYIKSSKSTSKKVAERMEAEWKAKIHSRVVLKEKPNLTLGEAMKMYTDARAHLASYKSLICQTKSIKKEFGDSMMIVDIESMDLERYVNELRSRSKSNATSKKRMQVIRSSIREAKKHGYAAPDIVFPNTGKSIHRTRYLTESEEVRLLNELEPRVQGINLSTGNYKLLEQLFIDNRDIVVMLLDTGARYSEIAKLQWSQIDIRNRTIKLWRNKTKTHTTIHMTDRVLTILKGRNNSGEFVFADSQGRARGEKTSGIRNAIKRAGLEDFKIHDLRHTTASRLIQNGMSLYEVAVILGHSSLSTTTTMYAHLDTGQTADKAANILNKFNDNRRGNLQAV